MSKFCGNCGTQLENNAKICGNCGTPLDMNSLDVQGLKITNPEKQKKTKNVIKFVVSLIVVAIIAIIGIKLVSQFTGYNRLLHRVMTAYENYDLDAMASMYSDILYIDEDWAEDNIEQNIDDTLDNFESSVGHNYKLSYEVDEIYVMSKRAFDELLDEFEEKNIDFDTNTIEKIVVADLTVTAKEGKKNNIQDVKIYMSKENNSWRLLGII